MCFSVRAVPQRLTVSLRKKTRASAHLEYSSHFRSGGAKRNAGNAHCSRTRLLDVHKWASLEGTHSAAIIQAKREVAPELTLEAHHSIDILAPIHRNIRNGTATLNMAFKHASTAPLHSTCTASSQVDCGQPNKRTPRKFFEFHTRGLHPDH